MREIKWIAVHSISANDRTKFPQTTPSKPPRAVGETRTKHGTGGRRTRPALSRRAHQAIASPRSPRPPKTTPAPPGPTTPQRAYHADWRHFSSWLRRQGLPQLPPDPQTVGLYLAACADGAARRSPQRRHAGAPSFRDLLALPPARRPARLPRPPYRHRARWNPPPARPASRQKAAIFADELLAMLGDLDMDLRGLRDRAILASASPGAAPLRNRRPRLRPRADRGRNRLDRNFQAGRRRRRSADDQRQDRLARSRDRARLPTRHLPRRPARNLDAPRPDRARAAVPADRAQERRRLRRATHRQARCPARAKMRAARRACAAILPKGNASAPSRGHTLRAGLASSAQIEEAHVQKHLGHASAEMTPPLPTKTRPVQSQPHQGRRAMSVVKRTAPFGPRRLARFGRIPVTLPFCVRARLSPPCPLSRATAPSARVRAKTPLPSPSRSAPANSRRRF